MKFCDHLLNILCFLGLNIHLLCLIVEYLVWNYHGPAVRIVVYSLMHRLSNTIDLEPNLILVILFIMHAL